MVMMNCTYCCRLFESFVCLCGGRKSFDGSEGHCFVLWQVILFPVKYTLHVVLYCSVTHCSVLHCCMLFSPCITHCSCFTVPVHQHPWNHPMYSELSALMKIWPIPPSGMKQNTINFYNNHYVSTAFAII